MYGPSEKEYTNYDNLDRKIPVLWHTEQKDRHEMANPQLNAKVETKTKNLVDENNSLNQSSVGNLIGTIVISDIRSKKLKRSVQPQEDDSVNPSANKEMMIPNNETKPQTFTDIINEFYRTSITYMWHFYENPRIFDASTYCNSYQNVNTCDLKFKEVIYNDKGYLNFYVAPDSLLQTKTTECMITSSYYNDFQYQARCRLMIFDDDLLPSTFDYNKFLSEKKSLLEPENSFTYKGMYRKIKTDDVYISIADRDASKMILDEYNERYRILFEFLYKSLAENNPTNKKFEPQNPIINVSLYISYNKNLSFQIETYAEPFMSVHYLYRKIYLESNYDQSIKDALKEIEEQINAADLTKNDKILLIVATFMSFIISKFFSK
ncbi:hypothetical protein BDAP_002043 [Binucleata daphniae]